MDNLSFGYRSFLTAIHPLHEPLSHKESSCWPCLQKPIAELNVSHKTNTWKLVVLPPWKHAIGCKWVYEIITNEDGSIDCYKVRLIAKRFQIGIFIDYDETFATVRRMKKVRTLYLCCFSFSLAIISNGR